MHFSDIGINPDDPRGVIVDQPLTNYPGIPFDPNPGSRPNTGAYGEVYTKWIAQNDNNNPNDPVGNADSYAYFMMAGYVTRIKGFYPSKKQVELDLPEKPLERSMYINDTGGNFTDYSCYIFLQDWTML